MSIAGKSPASAFLRLNRRLWGRLPRRIAGLGPVRSYGNCVHALARTANTRGQAFSTCFLRNRPELELIVRLSERRNSGETLRVAVLGCSLGAEAYSIAWTIKKARPDLKLILNAADISPHAVQFAERGVYALDGDEVTNTWVFERMTAAEKAEFFQIDGKHAAIKPWIKDGISWGAGDAGEPEIVDELGPQDMVVANNFLCHLVPAEAERCLRNIVRLVAPGGYLFVAGIDLDVRSKMARDSGWTPVEDLLEEIHAGDPVMPAYWPWHYGGLEPLDKRRPDWKIRYAAAFQIPPETAVAPIRPENETVLAACRR